MGGQQSVATLKKPSRTRASVDNLRNGLLRKTRAKSSSLCTSPQSPPQPQASLSTTTVLHAAKLNGLDKVMNSPRVMVNRSFRRSNASPYPYPRTHTTLMVLPSVRPLDNNGLQSPETPDQTKPRPPLNRAIPTIPESRSNESIMTQASERRDDVCADLPTTSTQLYAPNGTSSNPVITVAPITNGTSNLGGGAARVEQSLVIENRMAQNLATKTATRKVCDEIIKASSLSSSAVSSSSKAKSNRPEPPKSPLISVAHSVRSRLTKLGNRFGHKSDSNRSSIRGSSSLMSMRNTSEPSTSRMLKSTSMDGKPNAKASAIPIRTNPTVSRNNHSKPVANASASLRVQISSIATTPRAPSTEQLSEPQPEKVIPKIETERIVEERKQDLEEEMDTGLTPVEEVAPTPQLPANDILETIKAKENLNPEPTETKKKEPTPKTSMLIPSSKVTARMTTAFLAKTNKKLKTESLKPVPAGKRKSLEPKEKPPPAPVRSSRTLSLPLKKSEDCENGNSPDRLSDPTDMKLIKKIERSFIPLMSSTPKRVDGVRNIRSVKPTSNREAPLAECESSRVENSPAVEFPPCNFERLNSSPGAKRRNRNSKTEMLQETILEEDTNGNVHFTSPTAQLSDPLEDISYMKLISPATTSTSADTHKGLIDDEIKDQPMLIGNSFALIDDIDSSTSGRSSRRKRRSDLFDDEEVALVNNGSRNAAATIGFCHPQMPEGLDYELDTVEEQLAMISLSSSFNRPKNQSVEKVNGRNGTIFPDQTIEKARSLDNDNGNAIALLDYESSCKDLTHIKQQLLLLKNIFDNELNVGQLIEDTEPSGPPEEEPEPRRTITMEQLMEENDALRRQLLEKDKIIESLRSQLLLS